MKKVLFIVLILGTTTAIGQNNFFFSHYMFNPTYYNPAWVGVQNEAFAAFNYRNQWTGYSSSFDGSGGAPNTQMLTLAIPVKGKGPSGLGINVTNDNLGPVSNFQFQASLAYTFQLRRGQLGIGIAPTIFSQTQRFNELRFNNPADPLNIGTKETQLQPDVFAGLYYASTNDFYLGLAVSHILEPGFDFGLDSLANVQSRTFIAHGGHAVSLGNDLSLHPSVIVRSNLESWTFDLSAMVMYESRMWAGLSYRKDEAMILFAGYSFFEDRSLKAGYSLDYIIVNQEAKQVTSHEVFVRYNLPDLVFGGRKTVKTPRFSF